jgi:hypothetical protein
VFVWNKKNKGKKNTAQKSSCRHQQRTYFLGVCISFHFVFLLHWPNQHLLIALPHSAFLSEASGKVTVRKESQCFFFSFKEFIFG